MASFPHYRPRRLRRTEALRALVRETTLVPSQLVLPLFARAGTGVRQPVSSMPGVAQTSVDELVRDATAAAELGVGGVLLFGIPEKKDAVGSEAWDDKGLAGGNPGAPAVYVGMCHIFCDSVEAFQRGFGPHAKEIMADIPKYTDLQPVIQISEVVVGKQ